MHVNHLECMFIYIHSCVDGMIRAPEGEFFLAHFPAVHFEYSRVLYLMMSAYGI